MRTLSTLFALIVLGPGFAPAPMAPAAAQTPASKYSAMTDSQRLDYVRSRASRVARMLAANGDRRARVTPEGAQAIKLAVDRYAARGGAGSAALGHEELSV